MILQVLRIDSQVEYQARPAHTRWIILNRTPTTSLSTIVFKLTVITTQITTTGELVYLA